MDACGRCRTRQPLPQPRAVAVALLRDALRGGGSGVRCARRRRAGKEDRGTHAAEETHAQRVSAATASQSVAEPWEARAKVQQLLEEEATEGGEPLLREREGRVGASQRPHHLGNGLCSAADG